MAAERAIVAASAELTDAQKATVEDEIRGFWKKDERKEIDGIVEFLKGRQELAAMKPAEREVARQALLEDVLKQWWADTQSAFEGDVAFHDCSEVQEFGRGGSDDAGFVQVIQGRYTDPEKGLELVRRSEEPLREFRPDVIGGLLCLHGDDGFTQAVYFTSETEARAAEQQPPPPDVQAMLEDEAGIMSDLVYFDLTDPWLYSPK